MAFWTYILRCADDRYYTGHTDNLERRVSEHQTGGFSDFTSRRRPVVLVWNEYFQTRLEALEAERRIKPWSRVEKEALIRGDWKALSYYSKPPSEREQSVRPERSRGTVAPSQRPSTTLGTNGDDEADSPNPSHKREGR
ncbi:MAG: GIY-YIG nuclease family protein [Alphaproteobacteria bacterium]|nr:GIY-YIG nuclease family protein [Alphaproteobacteria bacterium]